MLRVTTETIGAPGGPYYTNFHFAGDTEGEAEAALDAVEGFWTALQNEVSTLAEGHVLGDVVNINAATGEIDNVFSLTERVINFGGGEQLPWATQGLIRWRTGDFVGGREIRGRTFVPAPTAEYDSGGQPLPVYQTDVMAAVTPFLTAAAGAGGLVVYSNTHNQASLVSAGSVWNQWAILRSRRD
jgi:hypothetical protein